MTRIKATSKESYAIIKAVAYVRVSSREQQEEGYSIESQLKTAREYATRHRIQIVKEYVEVESAKESGRTNFNTMIEFLKTQAKLKNSANPCRAILVEKTDRIGRNMKDYVILDDLMNDNGLHIHLIKEGDVISSESKSQHKFIFGLRVLMAKNYSDNLGEEAIKGMREKAAQGLWPTKAPFGYINVESGGKKIIEKDPQHAPLVAKLFEWYATGLYSVKEPTKKAHAEGLVYRRTGIRVSASHIHKILSNPIYYGDFHWNGVLCKGSHDPTITKELYDQVQAVLNGRHKPRQKHHDWAFRGLVTCGHCGCALTLKEKKKSTPTTDARATEENAQRSLSVRKNWLINLGKPRLESS